LTAVIDTSVLLYLLNEQTLPPLDELTGQPVTRCRERVNKLVEDLSAGGERLIVPTPVVSEVLGRAGSAGPAYLEILDKQKVFRIEPFGVLAAVEAATIIAEARSWQGPQPSLQPTPLHVQS
jgi:predicted nucleic acid-binding protein